MKLLVCLPIGGGIIKRLSDLGTLGGGAEGTESVGNMDSRVPAEAPEVPCLLDCRGVPGSGHNASL